jgi:hypothetical protein
MHKIQCTFSTDDYDADLFEKFMHRVTFEGIEKYLDTKDETYVLLAFLENIRRELREAPSAGMVIS